MSPSRAWTARAFLSISTLRESARRAVRHAWWAQSSRRMSCSQWESIRSSQNQLSGFPWANRPRLRKSKALSKFCPAFLPGWHSRFRIIPGGGEGITQKRDGTMNEVENPRVSEGIKRLLCFSPDLTLRSLRPCVSFSSNPFKKCSSIFSAD